MWRIRTGLSKEVVQSKPGAVTCKKIGFYKSRP